MRLVGEEGEQNREQKCACREDELNIMSRQKMACTMIQVSEDGDYNIDCFIVDSSLHAIVLDYVSKASCDVIFQCERSSDLYNSAATSLVSLILLHLAENAVVFRDSDGWHRQGVLMEVLHQTNTPSADLNSLDFQ